MTKSKCQTLYNFETKSERLDKIVKENYRVLIGAICIVGLAILCLFYYYLSAFVFAIEMVMAFVFAIEMVMAFVAIITTLSVIRFEQKRFKTLKQRYEKTTNEKISLSFGQYWLYCLS